LTTDHIDIEAISLDYKAAVKQLPQTFFQNSCDDVHGVHAGSNLNDMF
jgi:hypothetical protein